MSATLTLESKEKPRYQEAKWSWEDYTYNWDSVKRLVQKESKNSATLTKLGKSDDFTVDEMTWTVDEAGAPSTVNVPRIVVNKESKN